MPPSSKNPDQPYFGSDVRKLGLLLSMLLVTPKTSAWYKAMFCLIEIFDLPTSVIFTFFSILIFRAQTSGNEALVTMLRTRVIGPFLICQGLYNRHKALEGLIKRQLVVKYYDSLANRTKEQNLARLMAHLKLRLYEKRLTEGKI